jgi:hypothetical protein
MTNNRVSVTTIDSERCGNYSGGRRGAPGRASIGGTVLSIIRRATKVHLYRPAVTLFQRGVVHDFLRN